ncbi:MAG: response regulator [Pseudomonadota bacterium]|nr:response regulator [Pseudomonadota bacterium]
MANKNKLDELSTKPYTTQEVAVLFGVTGRTVQMWADSGIINVSKTPGGHRRISKAEVERLSISMNNKPLGKLRRSTDTDTHRELENKANNRNNKFTILIAEDDSSLRMLYRLNIEEWHPQIELLMVNDGYEALLVAGRSTPDLIITDLLMPNGDGFHLIDVLSSDENLADCKIVVVTGLSQEEIQKRSHFPETISIMEKPIPFQRLKSIVFEKANEKNIGIKQ